MEKIPLTIRLNDSDHSYLSDLAKKRQTSLNQIIIDAIQAIRENPDLLNPTKQIKSLDELIRDGRRIASEQYQREINFNEKTQQRFLVIEKKLDLLLKTANVSHSEIKNLEKKDKSSEAIFK